MRDEEAYAEHTPTSHEWFAAKIEKLQQNTEMLNRLLRNCLKNINRPVAL